MLGEVFWSLLGFGSVATKLTKEHVDRKKMMTSGNESRRIRAEFIPKNTNPDLEMALTAQVRRAAYDRKLFQELYQRLLQYKENGGRYAVMYPGQRYWERVGNANWSLRNDSKNGHVTLFTRLLMHTYDLRTVGEADAWVWARHWGQPGDTLNRAMENNLSYPHRSYKQALLSEAEWTGIIYPVYDFVLERNLTNEEYYDLIRLWEPEYGRYLTEEERQRRVEARS